MIIKAMIPIQLLFKWIMTIRVEYSGYSYCRFYEFTSINKPIGLVATEIGKYPKLFCYRIKLREPRGFKLLVNVNTKL